MNFKIKSGKLIKNSIGESFHFYINQKNYLILSKYDQNNQLINTHSIIEQELLDFSADIDNNNAIHLIFLPKNGNLTYLLYDGEIRSKKLIKNLDTKSNIYKYLNLYIITNKINIFYISSNLVNKNLWTIEHIIGTRNRWIKIRITTVFAEKLPNPYCIDYDKFGNIHLVFKAIEQNHNHIYYIYYNCFIQKWNKKPEKISSSGTNNLFPYIFIDSKSNINILWTTCDNNNYILNYKKLNHIEQDKSKKKEIKLSKTSNIDYTPIMIESNGILKIILLNHNKINYIYSNNYGNSWYIINKNDLITKNSWIINYSSNLLEEKLTKKANNLYCNINNNIYSHPKDFYDKKNINNNQEKRKSNITQKNKKEKDLIKEIYNITKSNYNTVNNIKKDLDLIKDIIKNINIDSNKNNFITKLSNLFK